MAEIPRALEMLQLGDRAESAGSRQAPQRRTAIGSNGKHARICTSWRMNGKDSSPPGDAAAWRSRRERLVDGLQHLRRTKTSPLRAATADPVSSWSCRSGDHVLATTLLYAHTLHKFALYSHVTSLVLQNFCCYGHEFRSSTACLRILLHTGLGRRPQAQCVVPTETLMIRSFSIRDTTASVQIPTLQRWITIFIQAK